MRERLTHVLLLLLLPMSSCVIGDAPADIREQVIDDQTRAAPLKPLVH